jgi:hypothetical protein
MNAQPKTSNDESPDIMDIATQLLYIAIKTSDVTFRFVF